MSSPAGRPLPGSRRSDTTKRHPKYSGGLPLPLAGPRQKRKLSRLRQAAQKALNGGALGSGTALGRARPRHVAVGSEVAQQGARRGRRLGPGRRPRCQLLSANRRRPANPTLEKPATRFSQQTAGPRFQGRVPDTPGCYRGATAATPEEPRPCRNPLLTCETLPFFFALSLLRKRRDNPPAFCAAAVPASLSARLARAHHKTE